MTALMIALLVLLLIAWCAGLLVENHRLRQDMQALLNEVSPERALTTLDEDLFI